ncbi:MAG: S-layer homology domain-containing protein, partial [Clostridia bacterium]|nr:S-layer homology domain-containing protein [Clostridia bacterium]
MKNLRRIVSLVLALCMVLSFNVSFAQAAEYTDVPDSHKYAEAINLLSGIGIITGYGNGTFRPEGTITRAEAATIMVRVLGLDDNVQQANTIFTDVDKSHWASGYINIAVENGIVNGFPQGTFLPDDSVTYEQIVKMVVCAIGHELKAGSYNLPLYPDGYIRAASDAKITKGLSGYVGMEAPRGLVAQLIYNALEVEMMEATSYNTGILGTSYTYNGRTLLRDYLDIEKVGAVVTDTYLTGETFSSRDKYIELEITNVYSLDNRASRPLYDEDETVDFDEGTTNASTFLGKAVIAYVGESVKTGKDTIFAVSLDTSRNDEIEVVKDRFFADESSEEVISYAKRVTDKRLTELELDRNVVVVVNGEIVNDSITEYFDNFDVMTLVDNNRDNEYDFVFIDVFDESEGVEFVVTDIEVDDGYYYFEGKDGELELDYEDDDVSITIIRDGEIVGPDEIEEDDVVTCLDASRSIITVYVSSKSVKGIIDEVDYVENEYYIDEKPYELSPAFAEDLSAGDYGTFYLNYQGKIAYSTVASRVIGGDYVFITNYDTQTKFSKTTYLIQAVDEAGSVDTYTLKASKMKYVDANGNLYKNVTPAAVYDYLTFNKTDLSYKYGVDGYVGLARVKVSSAGVISEIYIPGTYEDFYAQTKYASENNKEYSAKRGTYGTYDITGDEVAFRLDDSEEILTDAVAAGTVDEFFTDGSSYSFIAYGERGEDLDVIVITDGITTCDYEQHALIVKKVSDVRVEDSITKKIVGIRNGNTETYIIDPDENFDVEVGNIVLVSENAAGYVNKLEIVAATTDDQDDLYSAFDTADVPSDEDAGVYGGMVESKSSKRFNIEGIEEGFYNDSEVAYYLIDYTYRETSFTKGSYADIKVTSRIATYAIVRTYEDEVVDVFIFRMNAEDEIDVPTTDIWDNITVVEPTEPATEPTEAPTAEPTQAPTAEPTEAPTAEPTQAPTAE